MKTIQPPKKAKSSKLLNSNQVIRIAKRFYNQIKQIM